MRAKLALLVGSCESSSLAAVAVALRELAAHVLVGDDDIQEEERVVRSHDNNVRAGEASCLSHSGRDNEAAVAVLTVGGQSSA
jgi:hypothetical protein